MRKETTILLVVVFTLVLIGALCVYSASIVASYSMLRQFTYVTVGLALMFIMANIDYHCLRKPIIYRSLTILSLLLLIAVFVPGIGVKINGASRWVNIFGFRFQASELAKLAMVTLLAVKLSQNQTHMHSLKLGFMPPMLCMLVFVGLILPEPDLGAPIVLALVALVMMTAAGAKWRHIGASLAPGAFAVFLLCKMYPYRWARINAFLDPWKYRDEASFQLIQSLAGFSRGGTWGAGMGASEQKLFWLTQAHTDFIFAVWAEEMGLLGSLFIVLLFAALLIVSMRIAACAPDLFGTLLATGIGSLIAVQATINMAVTIGLLPTKGLPLPFVSAGGSALMVCLAMAGILLNIGLQGIPKPKRSRKLALSH